MLIVPNDKLYYAALLESKLKHKNKKIRIEYGTFSIHFMLFTVFHSEL